MDRVSHPVMDEDHHIAPYAPNPPCYQISKNDLQRSLLAKYGMDLLSARDLFILYTLLCHNSYSSKVQRALLSVKDGRGKSMAFSPSYSQFLSLSRPASFPKNKTKQKKTASVEYASCEIICKELKFITESVQFQRKKKPTKTITCTT